MMRARCHAMFRAWNPSLRYTTLQRAAVCRFVQRSVLAVRLHRSYSCEGVHQQSHFRRSVQMWRRKGHERWKAAFPDMIRVLHRLDLTSTSRVMEERLDGPGPWFLVAHGQESDETGYVTGATGGLDDLYTFWGRVLSANGLDCKVMPWFALSCWYED